MIPNVPLAENIGLTKIESLLFQKTYQAYQAYARLPRRTPEQYTAWERFEVLWELVEEAGLEAKYSAWREELIISTQNLTA